MGGAIAGNFFVGIMINNFGRRGTLLVGSVPGFISWVMILFGRSVEVVLVARFIMGVALSAPTAVCTQKFISSNHQSNKLNLWFRYQ